MALSVSRSGAAGGGEGRVVVCEPLKGVDSPISHRADDLEWHGPGDATRAAARDPRAAPDHLVAEDLHGTGLYLVRLPNRQPLLHVAADRLVPTRLSRLGPVGPGEHHRIVGEELEGPFQVAGVPPPNELSDDGGVVHGVVNSGPCTRPRSSSPGV